MIVLYSPKATRPGNRRFPLSVLSIAAILEGREEYEIVDGNLDPNPQKTLATFIWLINTVPTRCNSTTTTSS